MGAQRGDERGDVAQRVVVPQHSDEVHRGRGEARGGGSEFVLSLDMRFAALGRIGAMIAGLLIAARLGSGSANSATGFELTVITAVVLGGTNLFGGRGTVIGTVIGAVLTGIIANGLTLLGVSPFLTPIITGVVLLLAIWINMRGHTLSALWRHLQSAPSGPARS